MQIQKCDHCDKVMTPREPTARAPGDTQDWTPPNCPDCGEPTRILDDYNEVDQLTTQELAMVTKISINTLYFYIRKKLLARPKYLPIKKKQNGKRSGGVRPVFPAAAVHAVKRIRDKIRAGMTTDEIKADMDAKSDAGPQ
jgi:hypothetical protein